MACHFISQCRPPEAPETQRLDADAGDDALQGLTWDLSAFLPAEPIFLDTKPCDLSFELVKRSVVACSCQPNMVSQVSGQAATGIGLMFCGESQGLKGGAKIPTYLFRTYYWCLVGRLLYLNPGNWRPPIDRHKR